ncbi:hypothetical protein D9M69_658900 [compost metagenome]
MDTTFVSSEQRMNVPRVRVKSALARTSTAPRFTAENSSSKKGFFLPLSVAAIRLSRLAMRRSSRSSRVAGASAIAAGSGNGGATVDAAIATGGGGSCNTGFSGTVTSSKATRFLSSPSAENALLATHSVMPMVAIDTRTM